MRQSEVMDDGLARLLELEKQERLAKVHHQHLGGGRHRVSQFYTGQSNADVHTAMDRDRQAMAKYGATETFRTKIGRNATCPCGSGRKFKKCCISTAQRAIRA